MDSKRLIAFIVLSMGILLGYQEFFAPKTPPKPAVTATSGAPAAPNSASVSPASEAAKLTSGQRITVNTDVLKAQIDTVGGDLRGLDLLKHDSAEDATKPFELFTDKGGRVYVAQTGLIAASNPALPTHKTVFSADKTSYTLNGDSVEVKLTAPEANGVKVSKVYTFKKGSYQIGVRYDITNNGTAPVAPTAYFRLLRDSKAPEGEGRFAHTFTGPAVYTTDGKFQKVSFDDLTKGKGDYVKNADNGWVAMVQHYFVSAWLLNPLDGKAVCSNAQACQFDLKANGSDLFSAATLVNLPTLAPGASESVSVPLYAGPEDYNTLVATADGLERVKDYGMVHIFASPLFWLLTKLHGLVLNWGWAIILLTIIVKGVFYPLTAASYRSMAKMKALAPRLERLKEQYGDDRMKLQQAMMEMYKTEKINPLGGCLPILIQIPVFIGLYWALLASVELRQAPWVGWIHDLSRPDPFFVLPVLMAVTMFAQTFLNPPPADPMQAKMMKVMPLAFSAMFFFFPAGLVLYYFVNNLLSITQQWHINRKITNANKAKLQS
ncbi:membrane protein insertase YidC [Crenobacter sp. SG2303]|uniref:Membrane protein insertase YidC n=1 Tax=Crenobacter oryzisoli TaxID=3056844 RepID=A0ABT7XSJ9_9NEIS|nr:membrane protein insertase YidC [Crenobacter sp. SG2303]MDN0076762.1 membrane protein insertase YidC [Crenobacter sp. SG2303]